MYHKIISVQIHEVLRRLLRPMCLCSRWFLVLIGSSGEYLLGILPWPWLEESEDDPDLLGLSDGRAELRLLSRDDLCLLDLGLWSVSSPPVLTVSSWEVSSDMTVVPVLSFMLRNLGGGVRPDLADMVRCISTRLPRLVMERLEAELVRDLRPPPTWRWIK